MPSTFTWKDGLKDENGRLFEPSELKDWRGERAQAGRIVPRGWAKSRKVRRAELAPRNSLRSLRRGRDQP